MIEPLGLAAICSAFFVIAAAPGPATLGVIAVSLGAGRKPGLSFATGLTLGLAFWGVIAATGLGAILKTSVVALTAMKLLGGMYLLWLAWVAAKSLGEQQVELPKIPSKALWFRRGLVLNLSNPKAVFAWMATLSIGIGDGQSTQQISLALLFCALIGMVIYAAYALLFSTDLATRIYKRAKRWVDATVAVLFAMAGLGLIRSAFAR